MKQKLACVILLLLNVNVLLCAGLPSNNSDPANARVYCGKGYSLFSDSVFIWTTNSDIGTQLGWIRVGLPGNYTYHYTYDVKIPVAPLNLPPHNGTGTGYNTNYVRVYVTQTPVSNDRETVMGGISVPTGETRESYVYEVNFDNDNGTTVNCPSHYNPEHPNDKGTSRQMAIRDKLAESR